MLLCTFFLSDALSSETEKVPFATGEWPPYVSESLPDLGAVVVLLSAICDAAGIVPEYRFYPWARGELEVDRGLAFGTFPYVATKKRKTITIFLMFYFIARTTLSTTPRTPTHLSQ